MRAELGVSVAVRIAQLWASVPEAVKAGSLEKDPAAPVLTVLVDEPQDGPARDSKWVAGHALTGAPMVERVMTAPEAGAFLAQYPTFAGTRAGDPRDTRTGGAARWSRNGPYMLNPLQFPVPAGDRPWLVSPHEHRWIARPLTTDYRGRHVVLPGFSAADTEPLHPLLTWWAILFGLSMLCRYRPVVWTKLIDINHSPYPAAIEHLLGVGLDAVPDLIERTVRQVGG